LWRIARQEFVLVYQIIPCDVARDVSDRVIPIPMGQAETRADQGDQEEHSKEHNMYVHDDLLSLLELFVLPATCSLLLRSRASSAEAIASLKRWPKNFSSSSVEWNRSPVQESTSWTEPSK